MFLFSIGLEGGRRSHALKQRKTEQIFAPLGGEACFRIRWRVGGDPDGGVIGWINWRNLVTEVTLFFQTSLFFRILRVRLKF